MTQSNSNDDDGFYSVANVTETSYDKTDDITSGATYQYRVKARNEVGYGEYSSVISIIAATKPTDAPTNFIRNDQLTTKT